jgi:hypothetical protein
VNMTQARIEALVVRAKAVEWEGVAMKANDRQHAQEEMGRRCYTEEAYLRIANELYSINEQIELLVRSGDLPT